MSEAVYTVGGFAGAVAVLAAYFQVSRHAWKPRSRAFQLTNAVGAGLLILYSVHLAAWPNVLLNVVWLAVAAYILSRIRS